MVKKKKHAGWLLPAFAVGLLAAVGLFQLGFFLYFHSFYTSAEKSFGVPGLSSTFVPQGMESSEDGFFLSGYAASSGAARLYWVADTGAAHAKRVLDEQGSPLISHAGGVAADESFLYLVGGGKCYVFSTEEVRAPQTRTVTALGSFRTYNRASFCTLWNGRLLVGEYALDQRYRTDESHHLRAADGKENPALALSFLLDAAQPLGVQTTPTEAWSLPERAQGMSVSGAGRVVLSTSGALGVSQLYLYDLSTILAEHAARFWFKGTSMPLYFLDSASFQTALHLPPQAEETTFRDGELYVLFESAARRFRYGRLVGGQYVYRLSLPEP